MATTSRAQTAAPRFKDAALNAATLDVLDAEKRRLDELFAWFNTLVQPLPTQTPQGRAQHLLDAGFSGVRLAVEHAQERAQALLEQQRRLEQWALSVVGLPPEQVQAWHQQWLEQQQQTMATSTGLAQRWWNQTREQMLAAGKSQPTPTHV